MAKSIVEKLAAGEDAVSMHKSITKFFVDSIPGLVTKQKSEGLGRARDAIETSEDSLTTSEQEKRIRREQEEKTTSANKTDTKIRISDQNPSAAYTASK